MNTLWAQIMIGIPMGLIVVNATEWALHKYVQHGFGKDRSSFWGFHWNEHHRIVRKMGYYDPGYERPLTGWHAQTKEVAALVGGGLLVAPLLPVAPFFVATLWWSGYRYYTLHKRSHMDPEWGRKHLPWHYDHHMGPNPNANWCVTHPWFDHLMGTREPYAGTEQEKQDSLRRAARTGTPQATPIA